MTKALLHPAYFPNIANWVVLLNSDEIVFEQWDNYQKQTFRNRTNILGANGVQSLNVPINFTQKNRQYFKDVSVNHIEDWQANHWKSLLAAYSSSPYFEFYADELEPLFLRKVDALFDHNLKCMEKIADCMGINLDYSLSESFQSEKHKDDFRELIVAKKGINYRNSSYIQVFHDRFDFQNNLSILDLLFNQGPSSLSYLKEQKLPELI